MAIRPLDMQVMVPKIPEVGKINRLQQNNTALSQQQLQQHAAKDLQKQHQTVNKSGKDEKTRNNDDPRNKGKNSFQHKDGAKDKKQEANTSALSDHKIDIRV